MGNNSCRCMLCGMDIVIGDIMEEMDHQRRMENGASKGKIQYGHYGSKSGNPRNMSVMSGTSNVIIFESETIAEEALLEDMCEQAEIECDFNGNQLTENQQSKLIKRLSTNPRTEKYFNNEAAFSEFVNKQFINPTINTGLNSTSRHGMQSQHSKVSGQFMGSDQNMLKPVNSKNRQKSPSTQNINQPGGGQGGNSLLRTGNNSMRPSNCGLRLSNMSNQYRLSHMSAAEQKKISTRSAPVGVPRGYQRNMGQKHSTYGAPRYGPQGGYNFGRVTTVGSNLSHKYGTSRHDVEHDPIAGDEESDNENKLVLNDKMYEMAFKIAKQNETGKKASIAKSEKKEKAAQSAWFKTICNCTDNTNSADAKRFQKNHDHKKSRPRSF